jgi:DNA helicase HerA-like ATPase
MILPKLSTPQRRDLSSMISRLSSEMKNGVGPFDLNAVKTEIMQSDLNEKTASTLLATVGELEDLELFSKIDNPSISDLIKPGQLTVIDLSKIISQRKKQIIVAYFANKLFRERRMKKGIPPFSLFLEEAHNFIPEKTGEEHAIAKGILRTIAREGRKFGASLVIISQRPKHLDTTTLANCNTNVILRITNPYDLKHIAESCEALDQSSMDLVSSLRVGEALLLGEAVNAPTFFRVRNRKSQPSRHEVSLEEAAKMYAAAQESVEDEADAFL